MEILFAFKMIINLSNHLFIQAKEKRHTERIVHLWSTTTSEEQALLPVESSVKGRIQNKTLKKCFAIWSLKYQRITKLKNAYHRIVLERLGNMSTSVGKHIITSLMG